MSSEAPKADFFNIYSSYFTCDESGFERKLNEPPYLPPIQIANQICEFSIEMLKDQKPLAHVIQPVVVIGDIHGNFIDLVRLVRFFGPPPDTKYLFLGDYVDRGTFSVPVICFLLSMKLKFPDKVILLRGNHEFSEVNEAYGFHDEVITKYDSDDLWVSFNNVFNHLPLAATIGKSVFCVHGGLSPLLDTLDEINKIKMPCESFAEDKLVEDLVWSDPEDTTPAFTESGRGNGVKFGRDTLRKFLLQNKLKLMIRAHQCVTEGVALFATTLGATVFSSSNYITVVKNKSGAIHVKKGMKVDLYAFPGGRSYPKPDKREMIMVQKFPGLRRATSALGGS